LDGAVIDCNLIGGGFQHAYSSSGWNISQYINWKRDLSANINFYIDESIFFNVPFKTKNFGWLYESPAINQNLYNKILNYIDFFEKNFIAIFTHDKYLLSKSDLFKFAPGGGSWIKEHSYNSKNKLCSTIISNKSQFEGHFRRIEELKNYQKFSDVYGEQYIKLLQKENALSEYFFSVVFENIKQDCYFTEKIIDCFSTLCIPVYYGTSEIFNYFNPEGVLFYYEEKNNKFHNINRDFYLKNLHAVYENYELSKKFKVAEDWIYLNYKDLFM
jgi:Glycosyltransferase family 10 (fucosyltransferase) C-term